MRSSLRSALYLPADMNGLDSKEGQGRYLAIYEIETEDIEKDMEAHLAYGMRSVEQGLFSDLLELVSVDNFRKIEPPVGGYRVT